MSKDEELLVVLFCAPLLIFPEQPTDISKCRLVDCPTCKLQMWLSEKKESIANEYIKHGRKVLMECYICFAKRVKDDPECMMDHIRMDI